MKARNTEETIPPLLDGEDAVGVDAVSGRVIEKAAGRPSPPGGGSPVGSSDADAQFKDMIKRAQVDILVSIYNLWRIVQEQNKQFRSIVEKVDGITDPEGQFTQNIRNIASSLSTFRDEIAELTKEQEQTRKKVQMALAASLAALFFTILQIVL